jgi:hypothetical protein
LYSPASLSRNVHYVTAVLFNAADESLKRHGQGDENAGPGS